MLTLFAFVFGFCFEFGHSISPFDSPLRPLNQSFSNMAKQRLRSVCWCFLIWYTTRTVLWYGLLFLTPFDSSFLFSAAYHWRESHKRCLELGNGISFFFVCNVFGSGYCVYWCFILFYFYLSSSVLMSYHCLYILRASFENLRLISSRKRAQLGASVF